MATARTADLHLDGDAEILVRARVGLLARDYDGAGLHPARRGTPAVGGAPLRARRPRWRRVAVAARVVHGQAAENARAALRLRGTWNDPIVMPAE